MGEKIDLTQDIKSSMINFLLHHDLKDESIFMEQNHVTVFHNPNMMRSYLFLLKKGSVVT